MQILPFLTLAVLIFDSTSSAVPSKVTERVRRSNLFRTPTFFRDWTGLKHKFFEGSHRRDVSQWSSDIKKCQEIHPVHPHNEDFYKLAIVRHPFDVPQASVPHQTYGVPQRPNVVGKISKVRINLGVPVYLKPRGNVVRPIQNVFGLLAPKIQSKFKFRDETKVNGNQVISKFSNLLLPKVNGNKPFQAVSKKEFLDSSRSKPIQVPKGSTFQIVEQKPALAQSQFNLWQVPKETGYNLFKTITPFHPKKSVAVQSQMQVPKQDSNTIFQSIPKTVHVSNKFSFLPKTRVTYKFDPFVTTNSLTNQIFNKTNAIKVLETLTPPKSPNQQPQIPKLYRQIIFKNAPSIDKMKVPNFNKTKYFELKTDPILTGLPKYSGTYNQFNTSKSRYTNVIYKVLDKLPKEKEPAKFSHFSTQPPAIEHSSKANVKNGIFVLPHAASNVHHFRLEYPKKIQSQVLQMFSVVQQVNPQQNEVELPRKLVAKTFQNIKANWKKPTLNNASYSVNISNLQLSTSTTTAPKGSSTKAAAFSNTPTPTNSIISQAPIRRHLPKALEDNINYNAQFLSEPSSINVNDLLIRPINHVSTVKIFGRRLPNDDKQYMFRENVVPTTKPNNYSTIIETFLKNRTLFNDNATVLTKTNVIFNVTNVPPNSNRSDIPIIISNEGFKRNHLHKTKDINIRTNVSSLYNVNNNSTRFITRNRFSTTAKVETVETTTVADVPESVTDNVPSRHGKKVLLKINKRRLPNRKNLVVNLLKKDRFNGKTNEISSNENSK